MDSKISVDQIIENLKKIHDETNYNYIRYLEACGSKINTNKMCNETFKHFAIFFKESKIDWFEKLVIGQSYHIKNSAMLSIHAEHSALNKFVRINKYRRYIDTHEKIDILVIRFSKTGVIGYSRPCRNCLLRMLNCEIPINNIYYISTDGSIKVEKLSQMFDSALTVMSRGDSRKMLKLIDKN